MNINNQNGFTLVQAIFIMVVLALLGTYMVSLSTVQQSTTTQAVLQARAYQAARAGLEWGIAYTPKPDEPTTYPSFIVDGTGCKVTVTISPDDNNPYHDGTTDKKIYNIISEAKSQGFTLSSPDYVSRTLEVTIHD